MRFIFFILIFAPMSAMAKFDPAFVYLYEVERSDGTVASGPLLPNRVYLKYVPELRIWGYTLTDRSGKFTSPLEVIDTGTVLEGAQLGSRKPRKNFQMDASGFWKPTDTRQFKKFLIVDKQIIERTVTSAPQALYEVAPASRVGERSSPK